MAQASKRAARMARMLRKTKATRTSTGHGYPKRNEGVSGNLQLRSTPDGLELSCQGSCGQWYSTTLHKIKDTTRVSKDLEVKGTVNVNDRIRVRGTEVIDKQARWVGGVVKKKVGGFGEDASALSASIAQLNYLDVALGGGVPSKALILDASKKLSSLYIDDILLNAGTISSTNTNGNLTYSPNGSGMCVIDASRLYLDGRSALVFDHRQIPPTLAANEHAFYNYGTDGTLILEHGTSDRTINMDADHQYIKFNDADHDETVQTASANEVVLQAKAGNLLVKNYDAATTTAGTIELNPVKSAIFFKDADINVGDGEVDPADGEGVIFFDAGDIKIGYNNGGTIYWTGMDLLATGNSWTTSSDDNLNTEDIPT